MRSFAQIGPREKYLLAVALTNYYVPDEGATIETIMTVQAFSDSTQQGPFAGNTGNL